MTLTELIAELQKYPPETVAKRFNPDDTQGNAPVSDDVEIVAVIDRDGYIAIV